MAAANFPGFDPRIVGQKRRTVAGTTSAAGSVPIQTPAQTTPLARSLHSSFLAKRAASVFTLLTLTKAVQNRASYTAPLQPFAKVCRNERRTPPSGPSRPGVFLEVEHHHPRRQVAALAAA
jgi:hypothetical protein